MSRIVVEQEFLPSIPFLGSGAGAHFRISFGSPKSVQTSVEMCFGASRIL